MRKENQNQDTAVQADQELVKVKRKKRKRNLPLLIRIPIRLLVIILVCNFVVSFIRLGSGVSELVYDYLNRPTGFPLDTEAFEEELKNTASDIDGLTRYEKKQMGLNWRDGSDTDHDGLTDKEEIEVYHSDPLKSSTAGDLYTDGYKVEHNMDLFATYPYDQEITFPYNNCSEIILEANCPEDLYANIDDITDNATYIGYTTLKAYEIHGYSGKLKIDLAQILTDKQPKNLKFLVVPLGSDTGKTTSVKITDGVANLNYTFQKEYEYAVYLATGNRISAFINKVSYYISGIKPSDNKNDDNTGIMFGFPLLGYIRKPLSMYYSQQDTEGLFRDQMATAANQLTKQLTGTHTNSPYNCKPVKSDTTIRAMYYVLHSLLPIFECTDQVKPQHVLFLYARYPTLQNEPETAQDNLAFDPYIDELPFGNVHTSVFHSGTCAGIAHLTTSLYNNKTIPPSGQYIYSEVDQKAWAWDLKIDDANNTLCDPGLYDYKTSSFIQDHVSKKKPHVVSENLSNGEEQFINMINAYTHQGNTLVNLEKWELDAEAEYPYKLIEHVLEYLDSGKIVDLYFITQPDVTGHAVTVYDYYCDEANENILYFKIYDCDYPQDSKNGKKLNNGTCTMKIMKKNSQNEETFSYYYCPISPGYLMSYYVTSNKWLAKDQALVFVDDQWNILNDQITQDQDMKN